MTPTPPARACSDGTSAGDRRGWADLVARRCGLALRDAQLPLLEGLVRSRLQARGITTTAAYYDLLEAADDGSREWAEVIEHLVSHETSFFRHRPSFEAVRTRILPELRRRAHGGAQPLTFLSAGCSTGQEAYSLAMVALADDAIRGQFTVWGADMSRKAIDCARRGRYAERAVDGVPAQYRERYLKVVRGETPRQFEVADALRERVRFVAANLYPACDVFLNYDLILCQNVLIYLAPHAGGQLVAALASRLNVGGFLLLGPGEAPAHRAPGLEVLTIDGLRAFRRASRLSHEART